MRAFFTCLVLVIGIIAWISIPSGQERIKGACLVNPPRPIESFALNDLTELNAEWVAVIPYAFSRPGEPNITFDHQRQWWGEKTEGNCMLIKYAKENGLKVMIKPHVWSMGEGWVGDFDLENEKDWEEWELQYTNYILNHARKADSMNVEMLCIGTEYRIPARERPDFWRGLIKSIKTIYSGKITYASNWDNYENITWWDEVDYIGIDAYFPLVDGDHPSIEEIAAGWDPIKEKLSAFSQKWNRPILFTEYGFQSVNGAVGKHWEVPKSSEFANNQLQADAYEATFRSLEQESWFAGGFFWKWHFTSRGDRWRGTEWTPQNKPAEEVIRSWYRKMQ